MSGTSPLIGFAVGNSTSLTGYTGGRAGIQSSPTMHSPRLRNRPKRHGGEFNQTSAVAREWRLQSFLTMLLQTRQCPALVTPHKAGVADNVCGQDRRQFALLTGQGKSPVF